MIFWTIDYLCLAAIVAAALVVLQARNLNVSVVALSALGTVLTLAFLVLGAPDDAHAEVVVGAIALPSLYLIAIGKARTAVEASEEAVLEEEKSGAAKGSG